MYSIISREDGVSCKPFKLKKSILDAAMSVGRSARAVKTF